MAPPNNEILTKEAKKALKEIRKFTNWRLSLNYVTPHRVYNIFRTSYTSIVGDIRDFVLNSTAVTYVTLEDGYDYFVIRLDINDGDEGLLSFWRKDDLYVNILGVRNHGLYEMVDKDNKRAIQQAVAIGGTRYETLLNGSVINVGIKKFRDSVSVLTEKILNHDTNYGEWGPSIAHILVFLPEAVRNEAVHYGVYNKPVGVLPAILFNLIGGWKQYSVISYNFDPETEGPLTSKDHKLLKSLMLPDSLPEDEYADLLLKLKDNSRVLRSILKVPWNYTAGPKCRSSIMHMIQQRGKHLDAIHYRLSSQDALLQVGLAQLSKPQLKNILWKLVERSEIQYEGGLYKVDNYTKKKSIVVSKGNSHRTTSCAPSLVTHKPHETLSSGEVSHRPTTADPSHEWLMLITLSLVGHPVEVQVIDGSVYSGILHAMNAEHDFGVVLTMACLTKAGTSQSISDSVDKAPIETLIIPSIQLVQIVAKSVPVTKERSSQHEKQQKITTDAPISRPMIHEATQPAASSSECRKLFVGGIARETSEESFSNYFSNYGELTDSVIMMDKITGRRRGFGFLTFANPADAEKVLEQDHVIDGRPVEVKRRVLRDEGQSGSRGGVSRTKKIFVGGIPWTLTEDEMREYFSNYGDIVEHQIMLNHVTGRSRGFGFVTFDSEESVDKMFVDGQPHELGGKQVEIKRAKPKRAGGDISYDNRSRPGGGSKSYGGSFGRGSGGYGGSGYGGKGEKGYDDNGGNYAAGYGGGRGYGSVSGSGAAGGYGGKGYGRAVGGAAAAGNGYGYGYDGSKGYDNGSSGGAGSGSSGGGRFHSYRK